VTEDVVVEHMLRLWQACTPRKDMYASRRLQAVTCVVLLGTGHMPLSKLMPWLSYLMGRCHIYTGISHPARSSTQAQLLGNAAAAISTPAPTQCCQVILGHQSSAPQLLFLLLGWCWALLPL
jgi:hypothetical protein